MQLPCHISQIKCLCVLASLLACPAACPEGPQRPLARPPPLPAGTGLAHLALLQELWLGRNRIVEIGSGLEALHSLRRLSLQSNRLTSMAGLQHCTALEELYLRWVGGCEGEGWALSCR